MFCDCLEVLVWSKTPSNGERLSLERSVGIYPDRIAPYEHDLIDPHATMCHDPFHFEGHEPMQRRVQTEVPRSESLQLGGPRTDQKVRSEMRRDDPDEVARPEPNGLPASRAVEARSVWCDMIRWSWSTTSQQELDPIRLWRRVTNRTIQGSTIRGED